MSMNPSGTANGHRPADTTGGWTSSRLLTPPNSVVTRYVVAILISTTCFILSMILNHLLDRSMFQLALVAVVLSAWYGGLGPGLLSAFLEGIGTAYFILTPQYSIAVSSQADFLQLSVFVLISVMMSLLSEARQQAEASLQKRTVELHEANQQLEAFSYSVAHDLRSPLRVIDNHAREALEETASSNPKDQSLHWILVRKQVQDLGTLLDGLLALGRISQQSLRKQAIDLEATVQSVWETLGDEQSGRFVTLTIGSLPPCEADPALLTLALKNLLENALKFTRAKPEACIEVGCYSAGDPIYFIKDNGMGFDMQYTRHLFGVFERLHRDQSIEGTGLGLAIVQRIIRRHGGKIWAEAAKDLGATFYFTLPKGTRS